jgi:hypothetical protein
MNKDEYEEIKHQVWRLKGLLESIQSVEGSAHVRATVIDTIEHGTVFYQDGKYTNYGKYIISNDVETILKNAGITFE